jgi:PTS system mannose-specific IIA component
MPVGLLLLSHEGVASALLAATRRLLGGNLPLAVATYEAAWDDGVDAQLPAASAALRTVDGDEGVLVLVDLYGATPSRLAARLAQLYSPVKRVSGLGMPMLLRVLNYPEQPLDELARTAAAGARNGVVIDDA